MQCCLAPGRDFYGHPGIIDDMESLVELPNFVAKNEIVLKYNGSKKEISCCYERFSGFTGRKFLSQEENSCHRKKVPITGIKSCHRKTIPDTGRNFLSQEENPCHRNKMSVTRRKFLSQDEHS
jgi:hypothetical protein